MTRHEEHCQHTLKRYGITGDDIHKWMDEPSQISGASHRQFRHDLDSLPIAIDVFGKKYGAEMVENIFLDHLKADSEEARREKKQYTSTNLWTREEDDFLATNSTKKIEELETTFQGRRNRKEIHSRMKFLGLLLNPKYFVYKEKRFAKVTLSLNRGQKLFYTIDILSGGNRDIYFGIGDSKMVGGCISFQYEEHRIAEKETSTYTPEYSGRHTFNFNNLFSWFTFKHIKFSYHLENGREMSREFKI